MTFRMPLQLRNNYWIPMGIKQRIRSLMAYVEHFICMVNDLDLVGLVSD